jgi:hypothetical protein
MDTYAIYDAAGCGVDTIEAASEEEAIAKYVEKAGLKRLPKGWYAESIYA